MIRWICRGLIKLWGFRIEGNFPVKDPKKLYIVMPHTSNWDFPLGVLMKIGYRMDVQYIAKHSLFKPPFGWFFRLTGGIPVDRSKSSNMVDAVVDLYNRHETISIALAPEGTRKRTEGIRSGFYYIAFKAKVPLIFVRFDFGNKRVTYSEAFYPSGNYDQDLPIIEEHFRGVEGCVPNNFYLWP